MLIVVTILTLQVAVLALIIVVTGKTKDVKNAFTTFKYVLLYNAMAVLSIAQDLYYRNKQKPIECSGKTGLVAIVTGGGRGLGYFVTKGLVAEGMRVIVGVRDPDGCSGMARDFKAENLPGTVEAMELDTSSMECVKRFAAAVKLKHPEVHLIVNNAGVIFGEYEESEDGYEMKLATNYLGHFLLCHLLAGNLERAARKSGEYSRVVSVSSCAHGAADIMFEDINMKGHYVRLGAYAQSKLAQLMFSRHLNRLLTAKGLPVRCSAVHPGVVSSSMAHDWKDSVFSFVLALFKSEEQGAASVLYCCLDRTLETTGGDYISNMRETSSSQESRDQDKQRRLFELTCSMLDIESFGKTSD